MSVTDESWREKAKCYELCEQDGSAYMPQDWDTLGNAMGQNAQEVCMTKCPVRRNCTISALMDPFAEGIRGGHEFHDGDTSPKSRAVIAADLGIKVKARRKKRQSEAYGRAQAV